MSFRLVPKSVTLNDLERRNGRYFAFFSPNSVALGRGITSKWSKIDLYSLRQKCCSKNLVFSDISFAEDTENERIIERHLRDIHPLLDYDASESQSTQTRSRFDRNRRISTIHSFNVRP